jgi:hypothetical protein
MSNEASTTYGFNPHMTIWLALYVLFLRGVKGESWSGIACDFFPYDKNNTDEDLECNQLYGMDIAEAASRKLGFRSHLSGVWNS